MPNRFAYPRPEYPRPERQRGTLEGLDWLNLNGPWQFRFDPKRSGLDEGWHRAEGPEWREQILVPFCWESLAAWGEANAAGNENYFSTRVFMNPLGVTRANHRVAARQEVGWYRRTVRIPNTPPWNGKRAILTVGAADFLTDGWCNGQHLDRHEGGYTPFEFDLTDTLKTLPDGTRSGELVLRVEDPMDNREQPVGKQWCWYTSTSGIWQTVFLEPRHPTHISQFRFVSDIDRTTVNLRAHCVEADAGCELDVIITAPGGASRSLRLPIKDGVAEQAIPVEPLLLWNPNEPHLYPVVLSLVRGDQVLDRIRTYFGMRKIDFSILEGGDAPVALRLNNVPRYMRGALYQSFFPEGVYTAGDAERLRNDILSARSFGFNLLRIHIKVDDPLLLHYADRHGMLLMADFPNFGEGGDTPLGRRRFEQTMRATIERDFNHPSIIAWCMFNETWGFGGQSEFAERVAHYDPASFSRAEAEAAAKKIFKTKVANLPSFRWVQQMWMLAKQLDPTRLIEDMSVCHWEHVDYYQHGDTDINSWHFYISNYEKARSHIEKVVRSTFQGSSFNYLPGYHHKGQPLINSEYGGIGALDGDVDVSWSFKFLTNELRRQQQIAAYIYTELHDVEWERNGFLNYDRTHKEFGYDPRLINESNSLPIDAPPISELPPGTRVRVPVFSSHYSTTRHRGVFLQWRLSGIDTRGRFHQDLDTGTVPIEFPHLRVALAHMVEVELPSEPMLCALSVEACTTEGLVLARNFIQYQVTRGYPPTREELKRGLVLRTAPADWADARWSGRRPDRNTEAEGDCCYGHGHGYFQWVFGLKPSDLARAQRMRVLCEVSSKRVDTPQTDADIYPTTLQISVNQVEVYHAVLRNHPHDSRGVLSYLRGHAGGYGYLIHAFAEGESLRNIIAAHDPAGLRLQCAVPAEAVPRGGLTVFGARSGRYPVCPTVILEW